MEGAERVANYLNRWAREGLDTKGGADDDALSGFISDYFGAEETPELLDCK